MNKLISMPVVKKQCLDETCFEDLLDHLKIRDHIPLLCACPAVLPASYFIVVDNFQQKKTLEWGLQQKGIIATVLSQDKDVIPAQLNINFGRFFTGASQLIQKGTSILIPITQQSSERTRHSVQVGSGDQHADVACVIGMNHSCLSNMYVGISEDQPDVFTITARQDIEPLSPLTFHYSVTEDDISAFSRCLTPSHDSKSAPSLDGIFNLSLEALIALKDYGDTPQLRLGVKNFGT
ncbi:MAG: hypothetical protein CL521_00125 [Actinobacteria bacterium]|nr:hypothetical protein [Actinomycetota bacterium]